MSVMQKHPDADAFMRAYLTRPADATTRLVFADWLEETGVPHNAAWAYFIRLRDEATQYDPDSPERRELLRQAGEYVPKIRARLTVSANLFVGYPRSLLQLLPAANVSVRLAGFRIPRDTLYYLPESVARENFLFPLDVQDRTFLIASVTPAYPDLARRLDFILNRDVILVHAERADIQHAIDHHYSRTETYNVDSTSLQP